MVTKPIPHYNENLVNIVAYILKNYPDKNNLSKARVLSLI